MGKYKTLTSKTVHENPWFKVKKDDIIKPNEKKGEYFVVQASPNVTVVAINEDHEVYLVKLFRYPTHVMSLEIPSGGTDGEDPLVAAKRELKEEAGLIAGKWTHLGHLQMANGMADQWGDFYLAEELSSSEDHEQEEEGIEEILTVHLRKAVEMIRSGEINDLPSVVGIMLAQSFLD